MISYEGLERALKERNIGRTELVTALGLSSRTVAKIAKKERLSPQSLRKIADYLGTSPDRLMREVPGNRILQTLREEKEAGVSCGLYHELQVRMAYNSNHMEGSRLSEEQTRLIYETNTLMADEGVPVDDVLEAVHHFRAVDYVIDTAEETLTEEIIKRLHEILKHDTKDASLPWFAVGDYKKRPNAVGGRETAKPKDVPRRMRALLAAYNANSQATLEDIVAFHAAFELIHPFQDGNGRVGRLVALKECLRFNITPFIIEDAKKYYYYRGLAEWKNERGWLMGTCQDGQDTFAKLLDLFEIPR